MSGEETKRMRTLTQLVAKYFRKQGYKIDLDNTVMEGFSGISRKFDLLVQKRRRTHAVWIKNWKRTVGVNVVINLDKASEDVGLSSPILIAGKFSDHAKSYANRRKLTLLTKRQIQLALG